MKTLISLEVIEQRILLIRGQKDMLSTHLAELYDFNLGMSPPGWFCRLSVTKCR